MTVHVPGEPEFTIYTPAWVEARTRLPLVESPEGRALLVSAMARVESGWNAVSDLQHWLDGNRGRENADDDYGCLRTYVETEVRETFRAMALALAHVAADWPEEERASINDVEGWLSGFVRYVTVLCLAAESATVPPEFLERVRLIAPLGLAGEWFRQLSAVLRAIEDHCTAAGSVHEARSAVEFLTSSLPEGERERAGASLLESVEVLYSLAGPPPPEWLVLLRGCFKGEWHDAGPPPGEYVE